MHPEIRQDHPGNCPKCGMTLEPLLPDLDDDDNPELRDFQRRFWWTLPLTVIVFVLAMLGHRLQWMDMAVQSWVELVCRHAHRAVGRLAVLRAWLAVGR
jgi:Cu+-exporting ATPase